MSLTALIPWPYRWLALMVLCASLFGYGWVKGAEHGAVKLDAYKAQQQKQVDAAAARAGQTSRDLLSDSLILEKVKNDEIHAIQSRLAAALVQLRQRPARRADVPAAAAACAGATGTDLARPDAEFLARYDSLALSYQSELGHCVAQYNAAKAALDKFNTGSTSWPH